MSTPMTLPIILVNDSNEEAIFVTIVGRVYEGENAGRFVFLQSDGRTPYLPENPGATGSPTDRDVAIQLGGPGSSTTVELPFRIDSGRIWFSYGSSLVFRLNPGTGADEGRAQVVEPSVTDRADPNINTRFSFAEFTFNDRELFANISYVDLVDIPNAITIDSSADPTTQHVAGLPANGPNLVIEGLNAQSADGRPWNQLVQNNGLRIVSPNNYRLLQGGIAGFDGYFEGYVGEAWGRYANEDLNVTSETLGTFTGRTVNGLLTFNDPAASAFAQPSTTDIFENSSGALASEGDANRLGIRTILAAALNRSTLLEINNQPFGTTVENFYARDPTNHYARIVHQNNVDGLGYTFPFDDVPTGPGLPGSRQEGAIQSATPTMLTVTIGGESATRDLTVVRQRQAKHLADAKKVAGVPVHLQAKVLAQA